METTVTNNQIKDAAAHKALTSTLTADQAADKKARGIMDATVTSNQIKDINDEKTISDKLTTD